MFSVETCSYYKRLKLVFGNVRNDTDILLAIGSEGA